MSNKTAFVLFHCALLVFTAAFSLAKAPASGREAGGSIVREEDVDFDGNADFVMENALVKAVVSPANGGMVCSFVDKQTGEDFVFPNKADRGGFFQDYNMTLPRHRNEFRMLPFNGQVELNTPESGRVTVAARSNNPQYMNWVELKKTYRLDKDSSTLEVNYTLANLQGSFKDYDFALRIRNYVGIPDKDGALYVPLSRGAMEFPVGAVCKYKWAIPHDITAGWGGYILSSKKAGVVFNITEYPQLLCDYVWTTPQVFAFEPTFQPQRLAHDTSIALHVSVRPVHGLSRLDGADQEVAGAIVLDKEEFAAGQDITGSIAVDGAKEVKAAFGKAGDSAGAPLELKPAAGGKEWRFAAKAAEAGTYVIKAKAGSLAFERPVFAGATTTETVTVQGTPKEWAWRVGADKAQYRVPPVAPRAGSPDMNWDKLGVVGSAKEGEEKVPPMQPLVTNISEPHIPWARPYCQKPPRVLFVADATEAAASEVVELALRFDMEVDWVQMARTIWHHPTYYVKANWNKNYSQYYLKKKLKEEKYDAICVAANSRTLDNLTPEVLALIKQRRDEGVGVVWVSCLSSQLPKDFTGLPPCGGNEKKQLAAEAWSGAGDHFIGQALPGRALLVPRHEAVIYATNRGSTALSSGGVPLAVANQEGKTREVSLNWNNGMNRISVFTPEVYPYGTGNIYHEDFPKYRLKEYYYLVWGKAVYWAAGREPAVILRSLSAEGDQVQAVMENPGASFKATAEITVSDDRGKETRKLTREISLEKGVSTHVFPLQKSGESGLHIVNLLVSRDGKRIQFGAADFIVKPAVEGALSLAKTGYRYDESLKATLTCDAGGSFDVAWELYDSYGRLIFRASDKGKAGKNILPFETSLNILLTRSGALHAVLKQGSEPVIRLSRWFSNVPPPPEEQEFVFRLNGYSEYTTRADRYYRALRKAGVNDIEYGDEPGNSVKFDYNLPMSLAQFIPMEFVRGEMMTPILERYNKSRSKFDIVRHQSYHDPKWLAATERNVTNLVETGKKMAVNNFSYVDEFAFAKIGWDAEFSAESLAGMREWLKKKYGALEKLNDVWQSSFKSWEEAVPDTLPEARSRNAFASWADHRTWEEESYKNLVLHHKKLMLDRIPDARLHVSGTQRQTPWVGDEVWNRCQLFDVINSYGCEYHRNFLPAGKELAQWLGYGSSGPDQRGTFWHSVFHGANGIAFWHRQQFIRSDFSISEGGESVIPAIQLMQRGGLTLLGQCRRENYGIALRYDAATTKGRYYSYAAQNKYGDPSAEDRWIKLLRAIGLQYDIIASAQILRGDLRKNPGGYRFLVLPAAIAMSDAEAKEIRAFVDNGGVLIADHTAGLMTENCAWRKTGALDDLFGIRRGAIPDEAATIKAEWKAEAYKGLGIPATAEDGSIRLNGAEALAFAGESPCFLSNAAGKGRAYYLNVTLANMVQATENAYAALFRKLLAQMGVKSDITFASVKDSALVPEVIVYRQGANRFIGAMGPVKVSLPEEAQVYEMTTGVDMGRVKSFASKEDQYLYAVLPYKVTGVKLEGKNQIKAGETIKLAASLAIEGASAPDTHIIHCRVLDAQGEEIPLYKRNVIAAGKPAEVAIPTALNESEKLTAIARDVVSGKEATLAIKVTPSE